MDIERLQTRLKENNQDHLLSFIDQCSDSECQRFVNELDQLDFEQINRWIKAFVLNTPEDSLIHEGFGPARYYPHNPTHDLKDHYEKARKIGSELIAQGKVGGFVVAGGQGTRLGFDGPKGNFPASPIKNKTLFQLFAQTIAATMARYNACCPWYVMTSPINHDQTLEIFESNHYFGLNSDNVYIFQQGTLPNFDLRGRILLAHRCRISRSPDGHGGSLKALYTSQAIDHMKQHGVEYMSYWQVDNPMINIFDPLFIGLHVLDNSDMSTKALKKTGPFEKLGNLCQVDGKVMVIEYSDLPDALAEKRNPDGSLVFEVGSIGIHMISRSFVERLNQGTFSLPIHRAVKKIPYLDGHGTVITPDQPNGIKLETFVFDALPLARNAMILETERSEEFAPIKNATGVDSAESSRQMMINRAARWLEAAGVSVPRLPDGRPDCVIEIDPAFALDPETLMERNAQLSPIQSGDKVYLTP